MTILIKIRDCAMNYEVRTGETPDNIYLGRAEAYQLKETVSHLIVHNPSPMSPDTATVDGLNLYMVDADSHLEVS